MSLEVSIHHRIVLCKRWLEGSWRGWSLRQQAEFSCAATRGLVAPDISVQRKRWRGGSSPRIRRSLKMRQVIFSALAMLLVLAVAELASALGLRVVAGEWVGYSSLEARRLAVLEANGRPTRGAALGKARLLGRYFGEVVLHPYLGFVGNPDGSAPGGKDPVAVDLGFLNNPRNVLQKRSPEKLIVAFFGGSMANILSDQGREVLVDELRGSRRFSGKEVVLVSLGMGGYKQPQQLMALSYILVMGGELDIVVNIDGFNEVALPPSEARALGHLPPLSPQLGLPGFQPGPGASSRAGPDRLPGGNSKEPGAGDSRTPFRPAVCPAGLLWSVLDARLEEDIADANASLRNEDLVMEDYQLKGPRSRLGYESDPYGLMVEDMVSGIPADGSTVSRQRSSTITSSNPTNICRTRSR